MLRRGVAIALATQPLASAPPLATNRVCFVGDERGLSGLSVVVPRAHEPLTRLHAALRKAGIQIQTVRVTASGETASYRLDVTNLDGSRLAQSAWAEVQASVLECVLDATREADTDRPSNPPESGVYPVGSVTMNVEPKPTLLSTWIEPPWATAI